MADYEFHPDIEDFLRRYRGKANKEQTYQTRRSDLKNFDQWLSNSDYGLLEMGWMDIEEYFIDLNEQGYKPNTVSSRFESVRQLFEFLTGKYDKFRETPFEHLTRSDYTSNETAKHNEADLVYVTEDEMEKLAENAPPPKLRNELLIRLMFDTGVRESTLVEIQLDNVSLEERSIRVYAPKVDEWRTVYYRPQLDVLMEQWLNAGYRDSYAYARDSDYLFLTRKSKKMRSTQPNKIVRKAAEKAGIQEVMYEDQAGQRRHRITAHALRHGCGVYALKSGMKVNEVKEYLGHENIDMTLNYLQLVEDDIEESYRRNFGTH